MRLENSPPLSRNFSNGPSLNILIDSLSKRGIKCSNMFLFSDWMFSQYSPPISTSTRKMEKSWHLIFSFGLYIYISSSMGWRTLASDVKQLTVVVNTFYNYSVSKWVLKKGNVLDADFNRWHVIIFPGYMYFPFDSARPCTRLTVRYYDHYLKLKWMEFHIPLLCTLLFCYFH